MAAPAVIANTAVCQMAPYAAFMERVAFLWDELDDLFGAARYVLRKAWHGLLDREPRLK